MVGHQAIGVDLTAKFAFPLLERVKVIVIVVIAGKNHLPVMPPLDDVMRAMREKESGLPGHGETYLQPEMMSNNISVPFSHLRRTVETMLASMGVSEEIRGRVQSHGLTGVQHKHYNKYKYFAEKQDVLKRWERHLEWIRTGTTAKVISLRGAGG